jgi:hypothetical protein
MMGDGIGWTCSIHEQVEKQWLFAIVEVTSPGQDVDDKSWQDTTETDV